MWGHLSLPVSHDNEEAVCLTMLNGLQAALAGYSTTTEEVCEATIFTLVIHLLYDACMQALRHPLQISVWRRINAQVEGFCSHGYYIVNHLNALEILLCLIDYAAGKYIAPSCCNLQLWLEESSGLSD